MISSLTGKLDSLSNDRAIINVGGIGFQVFLPTSTLTSLGRPGDEVKLYTHLHVREDNLSLYGFGYMEELTLFEILLNVSGIGPRLALGMLSAMSADQLATAIATGNEDMLKLVPGIGKKTASRIILELKDKIGAGWIVSPTTQPTQENAEVLSALTALGYSLAEATKAIATLPPSPGMNLEDKVKLALQYFGGK